jgi:hypothetical protein
MVKAAHRVLPGCLQLAQCGPLEQQAGAQGAPEIVAEQFQRHGVCLLENLLERIGQGGALFHGVPAVLYQRAQPPRQLAAWLPAPAGDFFLVTGEHLGDGGGIAHITLIIAGSEGPADGLGSVRIEGVEHDFSLRHQRMEKAQQLAARLFEADEASPSGLQRRPAFHPGAKRFGSVGDLIVTPLAAIAAALANVQRGVAAVDGDNPVRPAGLPLLSQRRDDSGGRSGWLHRGLFGFG